MQNEDQYDLDQMENEVDAEQYIAEDIMAAGHGVICPLANSIRMEESDLFAGNQFIVMDKVLMSCIDPEKAILVLRMGWHESEGANEEYMHALELGWDVIDMEGTGRDEFLALLDHIMVLTGPCLLYVAGRYRHWRKELSAISELPVPDGSDGV